MTQEEFNRQVKHVFDTNEFNKQTDALIRWAYDSGAFDTSKLKEGDFGMAKVVLGIVFQKFADGLKPVNGDLLNEWENIKKVI